MSKKINKNLKQDDFNNIFKDKKVKQIYLILCGKNTNALDFANIFESIGEYKSYILKYVNYIFVNTSLDTKNIQYLLDNAKQEKDVFAIVGVTLDMIARLEDGDIREWCLEKQEENIQAIIKILEENNIDIGKFTKGR